MKKVILLFIIIAIIGFSGCSENNIMNINSFTEKFNNISDYNINTTDYVSVKKNSYIFSYYFFSNDAVFCIEHSDESGLIKSVSLSCKSFNDEFLKLSTDIVCSIDKSYYEDAIELLESNKKEYANQSHTRKNLSLYFTKTTAGCLFTVSYNEIEPYQTTVCPETAANYH